MERFPGYLSPQQWRSLILWSIAGVIGLTLMQIGLLSLLGAPPGVTNRLGPPLAGAIAGQLYISYMRVRKFKHGDETRH